MNPQMLLEELDRKQLELSSMNIKLFEFGERKCKTQSVYRIALRKEILKLRTDKIPVSIINDLVKGKEEIAELRYKKDLAESKYYTQISAIENKRLEIEVLRSKLTWLRAELQTC